MKLQILAFLFILLTNPVILAGSSKPRIVTSITPLGSIAVMLVGNDATVSSIALNNDCPHHYHLKPGDLDKVRKADIVIYIDDRFDGFAAKLMRSHNRDIIKISDIKSLKIINNNNYPNWHIWLDVHNVTILLEELSIILAKKFPQLREHIYINRENAIKQIKNLAKIKKEKLSALSDVILLDDSAEYFFTDNSHINIERLYHSGQKSLRYIDNLQNLLNKSTGKCLILGTEQDASLYKNFNATIVKIESENWPASEITGDLFYNQYLKIINQVAHCLK